MGHFIQLTSLVCLELQIMGYLHLLFWPFVCCLLLKNCRLLERFYPFLDARFTHIVIINIHIYMMAVTLFWSNTWFISKYWQCRCDFYSYKYLTCSCADVAMFGVSCNSCYSNNLVNFSYEVLLQLFFFTLFTSINAV